MKMLRGPSPIVLFIALLLAPRAHAEPGRLAAGALTPWPQVLPCREFARLRFQVMVPIGETNQVFDGSSKEVVWKAKTGSALRFRGTFGEHDLAAERIAVDPTFPAGQLPSIAIPGSAKRTVLTIWLGCADEPNNGIEWHCQEEARCAVAVVYGKRSAYEWPESAKEPVLPERLPAHPKSGPLGKKARAELLDFLREQSTAAVNWLDNACRGGRCAPAVATERAQLDRFLHAQSPRVIASHQKMDRGSEHYPAGYPTFDLTADGGGAKVSIRYDELGWSLASGHLTCDVNDCFLHIANGGTLGTHWDNTFLHAIAPHHFVIKDQALAITP